MAVCGNLLLGLTLIESPRAKHGEWGLIVGSDDGLKAGRLDSGSCKAVGDEPTHESDIKRACHGDIEVTWKARESQGRINQNVYD